MSHLLDRGEAGGLKVSGLVQARTLIFCIHLKRVILQATVAAIDRALDDHSWRPHEALENLLEISGQAPSGCCGPVGSVCFDIKREREVGESLPTNTHYCSSSYESRLLLCRSFFFFLAFVHRIV